MWIGADFTQNGTSRTGLTPTIDIYQLSDNSLAVNGASVSEIGDGGYKYNFTAYNASEDYYWVIDGGAAIPSHERYKRGWTGLAGAVPDAEAGASGGLATVDSNNYIAGIQGTKNTFDNLNDLSAAQVNVEADTALSDYDPPTKAEMDTAHALLATPAQVNAQVVDVIKTDIVTEMSQGAPPVAPTIEQILNYLYREWKNITITSGNEHAIYDTAGTTKLTSATLSKSGSTFTKGVVGSGA